MKSKVEQYYPTYTFKSENRDVVLLEFEEAQKIANGQTQVYGQMTNILLALIAILTPIFFNLVAEKKQALNIIKEHVPLFSLIVFFLGALLLRYFVDLQKQITINARKVVTLRSMLGLDYGHIHLTLPNWRVEGATNPFLIKYFSGWLSFQSIPFWVLTISVNTIWGLTINDRTPYIFGQEYFSLSIPWELGNAIFTVSYIYVFRHDLYDTHETSFLNAGRSLARLIKFKFVDDFEYIIYRAQLDIVEMSRLGVNFESLKSILIDIEDKTFYKNKGVSVKSIIRGATSQIKLLRKKYNLIESGGSTITMQLARTLFIPPNQNKYLRKFFEIWIALWLQSKLSKQEILNLYIVSVRYDYGVMGLSKAIKHFYGSMRNKILSSEESFVLVERLSNVTGTYRQDRINYLITKSSIKLNANSINDIYQKLIVQRKIKK